MSEQLIAVLWEIALFIVPAVAIVVAAGTVRSARRRSGATHQKPNGWIIAAAVVLVTPMLAAGAAAIASWGAGAGTYGLMMWSGIGLLLLACLVLGFISARAAGWTLVILAIALPALVVLTGSQWLIDDQAGTPTPESVFLGAAAVGLLFSLPALVSGILLLVGSRTREHPAGPPAMTPGRRTESAGSSTVSNRHVTT